MIQRDARSKSQPLSEMECILVDDDSVLLEKIEETVVPTPKTLLYRFTIKTTSRATMRSTLSLDVLDAP